MRIFLAQLVGLLGAELALALVLVILADLSLQWPRTLALGAGLVGFPLVAFVGWIVGMRLVFHFWPDEPARGYRVSGSVGDEAGRSQRT